MKKIAIIGSGNFGANAACFIAENRLGNVILIDEKEGMAKGKALDLMEAAPVRGFDVQIEGTHELSAIAGADVVVMAFGTGRKMDLGDEELLRYNHETMDDMLPKVKEYAPNAILLIQREPVAPLVERAIRVHGYDPTRVIGITGLVETARFRFFMANALDVEDQDASAMVIGGRGPLAIPLTQYANISGIPLTDVLSAAHIEAIVTKTRQADEDVLTKLRMVAAYYAPAAVLSDLLTALVRHHRRYLAVTVMAQGQYGLKDACVTLPVRVGTRGVEKILELPLTEEQQAKLEEAASYNTALSA